MNRRNGFTMMEVSLVLSIAGLIFLMAFFALPNLWASQRDTDRKSRITEFVTAIKTYQTNNSRGALPTLSGTGPETFDWDNGVKTAPTGGTTWRSVIRDYVSADFADGSGERYNFYVVKCLGEFGEEISAGETCRYQRDFGTINDPENVNIDVGTNHTMYIAVNATCDGDSAVRTNSSRSIAVVQILERGGRHCFST